MFINKYLNRLKIFIIRKTYFFQIPRLTAYLWVLFSSELFLSKKYENIVIVFNNGGGHLDLLQIPKNKIKGYKFLLIDKNITDDLFEFFFTIRSKDYEYSSAVTSNNLSYKKYQLFLNGLIDNLINNHKLVGFINFNFVYSSHREIINLAKKKNVPFVSVFKECLRPPELWRDTVQAYQKFIKKTNVAKILVHNMDAKNAIHRSNIINKNNVEIVGQSRSDRLFRNRVDNKHLFNKKKILFFLISPRAGLPNFDISKFPDKSLKEKDFLSRLNRSIYNDPIINFLFEYISEKPNVSLVVKGKLSFAGDYKYTNKRNVKFLSGTPDFDLLLSSDVVIGLNTTGLLEAVAANIPAISTDFFRGNSDLEYMNHYYSYDFKNVIKQVSSIKELREALDDAFLSGSQNQSCKEKHALDKYLGNSDGRSGERLLKSLNDIFVK